MPIKEEQCKKSEPIIDLDALLTIPEAANWLKMAPRVLLQNIRRKKIPAVRLNARVFRIHPRTVLLSKGAKL